LKELNIYFSLQSEIGPADEQMIKSNALLYLWQNAIFLKQDLRYKGFKNTAADLILYSGDFTNSREK
jgi:hypothetical protein